MANVRSVSTEFDIRGSLFSFDGVEVPLEKVWGFTVLDDEVREISVHIVHKKDLPYSTTLSCLFQEEENRQQCIQALLKGGKMLGFPFTGFKGVGVMTEIDDFGGEASIVFQFKSPAEKERFEKYVFPHLGDDIRCEESVDLVDPTVTLKLNRLDEDSQIERINRIFRQMIQQFGCFEYLAPSLSSLSASESRFSLASQPEVPVTREHHRNFLLGRPGGPFERTAIAERVVMDDRIDREELKAWLGNPASQEKAIPEKLKSHLKYLFRVAMAAHDNHSMRTLLEALKDSPLDLCDSVREFFSEEKKDP